MLFKNYILYNFTSGTYESSNSTTTVSSTIETAPGIVISNPSGSLMINGKKKLVSIAAGGLNYNNLIDGTPVGISIEPAVTYLSGYSQPTVAQTTTVSGMSDATIPTGETGNWQTVTTIGTQGFSYQTISVTAGTDYWQQFEIIMDDGSLPVPFNTASTGGDFSIVFDGTANVSKNPDTGAAGFKIIGPLSGGKYIVQAYFTASITQSGNYGIIKYTGQSSKNFYIGRRNAGTGRYPSSMFDNATSTPNTRSTDRVYQTISGFDAGQITIIGEFVCPNPSSTYLAPCHLSKDGTNYIVSRFQGGGYPFTVVVAVTSLSDVTINSQSNLIAGTKYKFVVVINTANKTISLKIAGMAIVSSALTASIGVPTQFEIGSYANTYKLNSSIGMIGLFDRSWSTNEMNAWAG